MKGEVAFLNTKRGMAALITENDEYTSFEVLGPFNIELGDTISGDLESLGGELWQNETKMEEIEVFVEDIYGNRDIVLSIIS